MRRTGERAGFRGSVAVSVVATVLLVIAITGARQQPQLAARGAPPWPAPPPGAVAAGVHAAGLSLAAGLAVATRFALHLDVTVNGRAVPVPAGLGVDSASGERAPLTTADDSGIVHVTSDAQAPRFTLGELFDEWQVALSADRLGGLHGGTVSVYVNGTLDHGDPGAVVLAPHQEIAVLVGFSRVPSGYAFPAGT